MMKAAILYNDKDIRPGNAPEPEIGPDEVLVRSGYAGICGTDLHVYRGEFKGRVTYPAILGHEFGGVIEAVGKAVRGYKVGDRVCVDTCSMLAIGEGMLVGSQSACLFLVQSESMDSHYVSSRPFRVNAGAVHAYVLGSDGRTKYLSEVKGGTELLAVDSQGRTRPVVVGRAKVEVRPLLLLEAEADGTLFTTILQNAETIRLCTRDGSISISDLKEGDKVLVRLEKGGRHFGHAVKESVVER